MTALVAVIHGFDGGIYEMKVVDGRDRPGHDDKDFLIYSRRSEHLNHALTSIMIPARDYHNGALLDGINKPVRIIDAA
jgi:hypothetical protein